MSGQWHLCDASDLLYPKCIILATRPLLFCFIKMRLQSLDPKAKPFTSSVIVSKLLQVCVESAKKMLDILVVRQKQSLLGKSNFSNWWRIELTYNHTRQFPSIRPWVRIYIHVGALGCTFCWYISSRGLAAMASKSIRDFKRNDISGKSNSRVSKKRSGPIAGTT